MQESTLDLYLFISLCHPIKRRLSSFLRSTCASSCARPSWRPPCSTPSALSPGPCTSRRGTGSGAWISSNDDPMTIQWTPLSEREHDQDIQESKSHTHTKQKEKKERSLNSWLTDVDNELKHVFISAKKSFQLGCNLIRWLVVWWRLVLQWYNTYTIGL